MRNEICFDLVGSPKNVIPAQAGIHKHMKTLDSRLRGNDEKNKNLNFYEFIKIDRFAKSPFPDGL